MPDRLLPRVAVRKAAAMLASVGWDVPSDIVGAALSMALPYADVSERQAAVLDVLPTPGIAEAFGGLSPAEVGGLLGIDRNQARDALLGLNAKMLVKRDSVGRWTLA